MVERPNRFNQKSVCALLCVARFGVCVVYWISELVRVGYFRYSIILDDIHRNVWFCLWSKWAFACCSIERAIESQSGFLDLLHEFWSVELQLFTVKSVLRPCELQVVVVKRLCLCGTGCFRLSGLVTFVVMWIDAWKFHSKFNFKKGLGNLGNLSDSVVASFLLQPEFLLSEPVPKLGEVAFYGKPRFHHLPSLWGVEI